MQEQLQAIVTVLSLVNPLVCGAMFARVEAERSAVEQRADATKVALAIVHNSHGRRARRDAIVTPVRRVSRRIHGGGWRRPGMDGLLHAQWSGIIFVTQCTVGSGDVSDALDPVRGKPRDDHRSNYTLCRPYTVGLSGHGPCGCRGGECIDVAGTAARRARCPPIGWRRICARRSYALHGVDRSFDGGSVRAYRAAPVRLLIPAAFTTFTAAIANWHRITLTRRL